MTERIKIKEKTASKSVYEIGCILIDIHSKKLYKQNFNSFEEYVNNELDYSKQHGYRLMNIAVMIQKSNLQVTLSFSKLLILLSIPEDKLKEVLLRYEQELKTLNAVEVKQLLKSELNTKTIDYIRQFDKYHKNIVKFKNNINDLDSTTREELKIKVDTTIKELVNLRSTL